jgi:hypothetical protein
MPANRLASRGSCVNDCTVGMALSTSPASALAFATLSWLARESLRTRRPKMTMGATTTTSVAMMYPDSTGLVTASIAKPPVSRKKLRNPRDRLVPTTVWINVVSVVSRDRTSPLCVVSKNCGLIPSMCS